MTVPGGAVNLPTTALTIDTLESKTQDMSPGAMKNRAVERFPGLMSGSTGLNPASSLTPFGILLDIHAGATSALAKADPNDIQSVDDLPNVLRHFVEGLPFVGQFVQVLEAINGTYEGNDPVLLNVQAFFAPIRKFFQMITGSLHFPSLDDISPENVIDSVLDFLNQSTHIDLARDLQQLETNVQTTINAVGEALDQLFQFGAIFHQHMSGLPALPTYVDIEDFLENAGQAAQDVVGTAIQAAENAGGWLDAWWNALTGQAQSGTTVSQAAIQAEAIAENMLANSIAIAQQQAAADGAANSGLYSDDDFERVAASDINGAAGSGFWAKTSSQTDAVGGYYAIADGHSAAYIPGSSSSVTQTIVFRRTNPADQHTQTLFQKIGLVIGTRIGQGPGSGGATNVRLRARLSDDETQEVFCNVLANGYAQFGYRNGSLADTLIGSPTSIGSPSAGTTFYLIAGTSAGVRVFQLVKNGKAVLAWNDTGSLSAAVAGANNGWGWGAVANAGSYGDHHPADVGIVSIADNTPVAVVGSTFRTYRASTANQQWGTNPNQVTPAVFDTLDYCSNDLTWKPATGLLGVTQAGTYLVTIRMQAAAALTVGSGTWTLGLQVAGVVKCWLQTTAQFDPASASGTAPSAHITSVFGIGRVYIPAGQSLVVVWAESPGSNNCVGDAGGVKTYLEVTKVG